MAETGSRRERRKKLSIEQYIDFVQGGDEKDLTHEQLNQIIEMHGFKKRHKEPKKSLVEALSKIELMDLARSTIQNDHVSSCAHLSLKEAIKALEDLEWQECHVSSLVTVNAFAVDDSAATPIKPRRKKAAGKETGEGNDSTAPNPSKAIASQVTTVAAKGIPPSPASVDTCASLIGGKAQQLKRRRKKREDESNALKPRNVIAKKGTTSSLVGSVATCAPVIGCGEKKPPRVKREECCDGFGVSTSYW